jgi:uncharacterized OB-fold protein
MIKSKEAASQIPAVEGWFTWPPSEEPHLIGRRCKQCGDYFFPKTAVCRNPKCMSAELEEVLLSRKGKLYTYTINYFPAPPPYVPAEPYVPQGVASVKLEKEKMLIQGIVVDGFDLDKLEIGMDMELVLEPLYKDEDGREVMIWKFKPI